MIYIAVVDNEKKVLNKIQKVLYELINDNIKIDFYTNANEFLNELDRIRYQIIISDISMPGINGIEMVKRAKMICPELYIIFLTAYVEYAIESYRMEAYQYVLKDEVDERLPEIMHRLINTMIKRTIRFCYIGSENQKVKMCYDNIIRIVKEKSAKYVNVVTSEGVYRERSSIEKMLMRLNGEEFALVDRGCAINLRYVKKIKGNLIYLNNSDVIEASRSRIKDVKIKLKEYWGEK